jgi:hypothetical protein
MTSFESFKVMTKGLTFGSDLAIALASQPCNFVAIARASGKKLGIKESFR